ncbi:MAG: hypothetical protein M1839_000876 [Geoglossum umbratile]|nr:MAG: hypothetical protein M1839_000876 [Geoglossum umbratile]
MTITSTSPPKTVTTRLLILSDTHTIPPFASTDTSHAYRQPLPRADILLHAGDLTMSGYLSEYARMISFLAAAPAELKLVIAGNHDVTLDAEYYQKGWRHRRGGEEDVADAKKMWTGEAARAAGIVYLEEGIRTFRLRNGARFTIYTSPYQPEFFNWAFNYPHDQDRFNPPFPHHPSPHPPAPNPIPSFPAIDLLMTHGPPRNILDQTSNATHAGCPHLLRAASRARPRLHCFGHIHEGWGAERVRWEERGEGEAGFADGEWRVKEAVSVGVDRAEMLEERAACVDLSEEGGEGLEWGRETLFVNASVLTRRYKPENAPWRVDLELPFVGEAEGEGEGDVEIGLGGAVEEGEAGRERGT